MMLPLQTRVPLLPSSGLLSTVVKPAKSRRTVTRSNYNRSAKEEAAYIISLETVET